MDKLKWPQILHYPYRILSPSGLASGKTNGSLNLKSHQENIAKIYLYAKDPMNQSINY